MKKYILLFAILLTSVYAEPIRITDFSGGLNTNISPFLMKPNQATVCTNWDLSKGMLLKRLGYNVIDTSQGGLRLGGIYGFTGRDGTKRLFAVERAQNSAGQPWYGIGKLCQSDAFDYTPQYTSSFTTTTYPRVWQYVYYGDEPPTWTTWKNDVYFANGRQRPLVYHDGYIRMLTPPAPGEPFIVPMADSGAYGGLNGEYRYLTVARGFCGASLAGQLIGDESLEECTPLGLWSGITEIGTVTLDTDNELVDTGCAAMNVWYNNGSGDGLMDTIILAADTTYRFTVWAKGSAATGNICAGIWAINRDTVKVGLDSLAPTISYGRLEFYYTPVFADTVVVYIGNLIRNPFGDDDVDWYYDSLSVLKMSDVQYAESYISQPVKAFNEKVILTYFPFHTLTKECNATDSAGWDSLALDIFRTLANPGTVTSRDSFFMVESFSYLTQTNIDTLRVIDSLPDTIIDDGARIYPDTLSRGRDSNGIITGYRVGAPTYVASHGTPIFPDVFVSDDSINVVWTKYICTYLDTLIGAESDSSRSLYIACTSVDSGYSVGLPPIPEYMPNYIRRLYRSFEYINCDTAESADTTYDTVLVVDDYQWMGIVYRSNDDYRFLMKLQQSGRLLECKPPLQDFGETHLHNKQSIEYHVRYTNRLAPAYDTLTTPFFCIAEIKGSDSIYIDTVGFDSMLRGPIYWRSGAPVMLNYITAFDDKLWGAVGAYVYWSYLDSASYWGAFRNIALNPDDGDVITAVIPFREYVKVYKGHSQYVLTPATDGGYSMSWVVEGIGCVAPHSIAKYNNAIIYLSTYGVVSEGAGQYLERASDAGIISTPINDILLNRSVTELQNMVAAPIVDQKYRLTLPMKDTTFVYDFVTGSWSIWTYSFFQSTLFDTVQYKQNTKSQDLLFTKKTSQYIYRADTTNADNGTAFQSRWKSSPIGISSDLYKLSQIGIWRWGKTLQLRLYNEDGDSVGYKATDATGHYDLYGLSPNLSGYFQVDVRDGTTADTLRIESIDIWLTEPTARQRK